MLALAIHAPTITGEFVFDDHLLIVENPKVQDLRHLGSLFTSGYWPGHELYYRPFTMATYALNAALGGLDPRGFHFVNVLLHALNVALLGVLVARFSRSSFRGVVGASLLFAVHPVVVEPVAWISSRSDLLASAGILGVLVLGAGRRAPRGPLIGLVALCGFLSKESGLLAVPLLVLADAWEARSRASTLSFRLPALARRYAWIALALAVYLALRLVAIGLAADPAPAGDALHNPIAVSTGAARLASPLAVLWHAFTLIAWPATLSSDYALGAIPLARSFGDARALGGVLLLASAAALAIASFRRGGAAGFGAALALICWLPVSNTIVLGGAMFGERFLYAPLLGVAIASGAALEHVRRRAAVIALLALMTTAWSARSVVRGRDWEANGTLYASAVAAYPRCAQAQYNDGYVALERAMRLPASDPRRALLLRRAEERFAQAIDIHPGYFLAQLNAGVTFGERGEWERATAMFTRAQAIEPDDPRPPFNLGLASERRGQTEAAIGHYRRSHALAPDGPAAAALARLRE